MLRRRGTAHQLGAMALVGVAYYLGARLGLQLSLVEDNVTPLWPPTGIAVAAFLLLGRSVWPGVALAAFAVNLPISEGALPAAVTAAGNVLAPLLAVALLQRVGFRRQLDRQRDALAIVFLAALASMTVSATIGAGTLVASDVLSADEFPGAWAVWWTGDAMGVLAVAPFLLSIPLFRELEPWSWKQWAEGVTVLAVVALVTMGAAYSEVAVLFLVLPLLGWASWRLQLRGAAPAALVASLVITWEATRELGVFDGGSLAERMLSLQSFNACVALTSFFLAALVTERLRNQEALLAAAVADHQIAETLQRSLLPDRLPAIPGISLAVRYVPATTDVQIGGDWYDVVQLPGGYVGLAIGDVAGHGLNAAATMGQVRMALRAYALQDPAPSSVVSGLHRLVADLGMPEMITLMYLLFDPATRELRYVNAGHPPALVVDGGSGVYLEDCLSPPIGVTAEATYPEARMELAAGATLVLYTDGLVERRGVSIQEGLDRLSLAAGRHGASDPDDLCEHLVASLVEADRVADDIALLAMRAVALVETPLTLSLPAEPRILVHVRTTLRRWLSESAVPTNVADDILIACGEACANVVQHAYATAPGELEVRAHLVDGSVEISIRDHGEWRPKADRGGGWGLQLARGLMDSVDIASESSGTEVRMRRQVETGGSA